MRRALFLVDGEHHPSAILDAVRQLEEGEGLVPVGLFFLGGTEKVSDLDALASPRWELVVAGDLPAGLAACVDRLKPEVVVDLSDLPVLDAGTRLSLASVALAHGATYRGADFEFRPPRRERILTGPSCAVIGTGKRCGKTAVSAEMARCLSAWGYRTVVVAMGRGGPPQPYLVDGRGVDEAFLLDELSKGLHAASDHYEDALVTGLTTVGSRRCGGGMAGQPFVTNCAEAARLAESLGMDAVIMEGSGSSIPPVETRGALCVISAAQDPRDALEYLGPYRVLISDGVVITMAEEPFADPRQVSSLRERIKRIKDEILIIETVFRPHPLKPIGGKRVFLAATAPPEAGDVLRDYLEEETGCRVAGMSFNLSDRGALRRELEEAQDAEVFLTELKAAAVDTVARYAEETGREVVYFHNLPIPARPGERLEDFFRAVWERVLERT